MSARIFLAFGQLAMERRFANAHRCYLSWLHGAIAICARTARIDRQRGSAAALLLAALIILPPIYLLIQTNGSREIRAPYANMEQRWHAPIALGHETPKVELQVFADLDPITARELNASVPFIPLGADRPIPFHMRPERAEFARARDCLASAMLYEAGDDRRGQAAIAQVVLNRVRHPAFPHSICAVVYQGSERTTGCQFTFTCDGALRRIPSASAWHRARTAALAFLTGETYPAVGMATHYHTDWVHPYWSRSLDKIARVDSHLFFRWHAGWGRISAFKAAYANIEPFEPKLAVLSLAHRDPILSELAESENLTNLAERDFQASYSRTLNARDGDFFILVDGNGDGSRLAMQGLGRCEGRPYCKVVGWDQRSQLFGSPENPVIRTVVFLYVSDKRTGVEIVLWDCARFNRPSDEQCLSDKNRRWINFQGDFSHAS
ncbi:cell wall hydrolase [Novosphingobium sp. BL-52-GroH]|uniref:cell wall hydrolase n=1 Tax=Novosphingobium sp. BL-52-GroH TaxID=3349877 RepID=UPI00384FDE40